MRAFFRSSVVLYIHVMLLELACPAHAVSLTGSKHRRNIHVRHGTRMLRSLTSVVKDKNSVPDSIARGKSFVSTVEVIAAGLEEVLKGQNRVTRA